MFGQGSPTHRGTPRWVLPRRVRWATLLVAALAVCASASAAWSAPREVRLRMAWGGGSARQWNVRIGLDVGSFSGLVPLGIEADENCSMWLDDQGVAVRQRTGRTYDALEVTVLAETNAVLRVVMTDELGGADRLETSVPISDLLTAPYNGALDDDGNRLFIARAPGDLIDLRLDRDQLILRPGEEFAFAVLPRPAEPLPVGTKLQVALREARGSKSLWSQEYEIDVAQQNVNPTRPAAEPVKPLEIPVALNVPEAEGAYQLEIALIQPGLAERLVPVVRRRLIGNKVLASRGMQFLVLASQSPQATTATPLAPTAPWQLVAEIDPANPGWWNRLVQRPQFSLIPGWPQGPLRSGPPQTENHLLGQMVRLQGSGDDASPGWEAYPLPIDRIGQPHILEVEFPADAPQQLLVSIVEPDAAGNVMPIGLDTGVTVPESQWLDDSAAATHRVMFWPRSSSPLVLIAQAGERRALFRKIRVFAGPKHLPRSSSEPNLASQRRWGGFWDRPLLAENFNASQLLDDASGQSIDDWQTFFEAGTRLAEYLHYTEQNAAIVSVFSDGSSIYPSQIASPTPRYDTGILGLGGNDPLRKDGLEMLLQVFAREDLTLIPAVQFAAPLPELESLLRQGSPASTGLELVDAHGQTWLTANSPRRGLAPYYNPLDERVQMAMLNLIRELTARYGSHSAWGGLALQLTAAGYGQLPGPEWGFDDVTIARFARETGIQVPGTGAGRFRARAEFLLGPERKSWLDWRAQVLAKFYLQMQREVAQSKPDSVLYLAAGELFDAPAQHARLRPSLTRSVAVDEVLMEMGIDPRRCEADAGLVLMRPRRFDDGNRSVASGANFLLSQAAELDRALAASNRSTALLYHAPHRHRLASFDAKSPYGPQRTYTLMVVESVPQAAFNRRRFIEAISAQDPAAIFAGGWFAPLGQEESLRPMVRAFCQLPTSRFSDSPASKQPLKIRLCTTEEGTFGYFLNESPWAIDATIQFSASPGCRKRMLGGTGDWEAFSQGTDGSVLPLSLEAYGFAAIQFSQRNVQAVEVTIETASQPAEKLQEQIRDLSVRAAALGRQPQLDVLDNAGFEKPLADGTLPDWKLAGAPEAIVAVDSTTQHGGAQSLRFKSTGKLASLESDWFKAPETGRLAFSVWMRTENTQQQPMVQLAVVGASSDGPVQRFTQVGGNRAQGVPLKENWTSYVFQIDDLPTFGLERLQVRFDLIGSGEVWIDDVELYPLSFTKDERIELSKILVSANGALQNEQWTDCLRLVESYWAAYLLKHVAPPEAPSIVSAQLPKEGTAKRPVSDTKPGFTDRVKDYLPRWRF